MQHFAVSQVNAGHDTGIDYGETAQLFGYGSGSMVWSPAGSLSCDSCVAPVASPEHSTTYTVEMTDIHGCKVTDEVTVFVNGTLYVPNTFTPDGDGINDGFFAFATEIDEFRLLVFNRFIVGEKETPAAIESYRVNVNNYINGYSARWRKNAEAGTPE